MISIIRDNRYFLMLCLVLTIALGTVLVCYDKGSLHCLLCMVDRHAPLTTWLDPVMKYWTHIGAVGVYITAVLLLLLRQYKWSGILLLSEISSGIVVQIIKHIAAQPRPLTWFAEHAPEVTLPIVDGQRLAYHLSFPSGHTASCFVLFFVVAMLVNEKKMNAALAYCLKTLCFMLAVMGGYSRIYLSMHFTADVLAGMIIGVTMVLVCTSIWPILQTTLCKMHVFERKKQKNHK